MSKFLNYLREQNLISQEIVNTIQSSEYTSIVTFIAQRNLVVEDKLLSAISAYFKVSPIRLKNYHISPSIIQLIPAHIVKDNYVVPIGKIGNTLTVAMVDPSNVVLIDNLKKITGYEINVVAATFQEIKECIDKYYGGYDDLLLEELNEEGSNLELIQEKEEKVVDLVITDTPVIKLISDIIHRAINENASDILIEALDKAGRVRMRVDGLLREVTSFNKNMYSFVISRIKVMANLDITEHRLPQEGRFRQFINNREVDFRVSILPSGLGEKVAIRILDKASALLNIDLLGFEDKVLAKIKEDSLSPHGMMLVCGPTGSGKTTTLYSILHHIYSPHKNIITVEDPVEYQILGINQVNVNEEVNLTFVSALRAILRQDPDIIMIGEIRDMETAEIAVKASLTGHFVLSTLHTTTSSGSITRLLNMGIESFLIASTLTGVIAQRLVRKLCNSCKQQVHLSDPVRNKYFKDKSVNIFSPKGCRFCNNMGYRGRISIAEYLQVTHPIKKLITDRSSEHKIRAEAKKEGMVTLREDGLIKVEKGITSLEEVLRVTSQETDEY